MKKLEQHTMENISGGKLCGGHGATITGFACAASVIICFTPFLPLVGALAITCGMGFTCEA